MKLNLDNALRSLALVIIGLPLTGAVYMGVGSVTAESPAEREVAALKSKLTIPCVKWFVSKKDSALDETAEERIKDIVGDKGVDYKGLCDWVL